MPPIVIFALLAVGAYLVYDKFLKNPAPPTGSAPPQLPGSSPQASSPDGGTSSLPLPPGTSPSTPGTQIPPAPPTAYPPGQGASPPPGWNPSEGPLLPPKTWRRVHSVIGHTPKGHPLFQGVAQGQSVRLSMNARDLAAAGFPYGLGASRDGIKALVSTYLPTKGLNAYGFAPGDTLPSDWPLDDVNAKSEYHAEFITQVGLTQMSLPAGALAWVLA
jgi:hypothetical protein